MADVKDKILGSFKTLEKNFIDFAHNSEIQKTIESVKKMKTKRQKQVDKMLNSNIKELRKGYGTVWVFMGFSDIFFKG